MMSAALYSDDSNTEKCIPSSNLQEIFHRFSNDKISGKKMNKKAVFFSEMPTSFIPACESQMICLHVIIYSVRVQQILNNVLR